MLFANKHGADGEFEAIRATLRADSPGSGKSALCGVD